MNGQNESWDLKSFVEALSAELDRAQDLLRVKALNRPLTYSVQDISLDLKVVAEYDGDTVIFRTASEGDVVSTLQLKLGSITDRVVVETTKPPPKAGERLEDMEIPVLDEDTRRSLRKLGAETIDDVQRLGKRSVRIKTNRGDDIDFAALAAMMDQSRKPRRRPRIRRVASFSTPQGARLRVFGEDIAEVIPHYTRLNGTAVQASLHDGFIELDLGDKPPSGDLILETIGGEQLFVRLVE